MSASEYRGMTERYRFHPTGAAFGCALGQAERGGLAWWRDLRPDPERPLAQWEPMADWRPYAPDESAQELALELMRVAGLVQEVGVVLGSFPPLEPLPSYLDPQARGAIRDDIWPPPADVVPQAAHDAEAERRGLLDPQARATAAALAATERALKEKP